MIDPHLLTDLTERGLVAQMSDPAALASHLATARTLYCGFDPTAGSLHIGHPIVVTQRHLLVIPRAFHWPGHQRRIAGDAVTAQQAHGLGQCRVIGHGHATFPRGDDLNRMEAEDCDVAVAAVAGGLVVITGAKGVAGIFDDAKTILLPQAVDLFHVAGQACEVYRDHHLGQTTFGLGSHQFSLQLHGTHIAGIGFDIDKIDSGATIEGAVGGGHEADGRGPDPVT